MRVASEELHIFPLVPWDRQSPTQRLGELLAALHARNFIGRTVSVDYEFQ